MVPSDLAGSSAVVGDSIGMEVGAGPTEKLERGGIRIFPADFGCEADFRGGGSRRTSAFSLGRGGGRFLRGFGGGLSSSSTVETVSERAQSEIC